MSVDLKERLKALDEAREKIIHDSFIQKQQQLEDEIKGKIEKLKKKSDAKGEKQC